MELDPVFLSRLQFGFVTDASLGFLFYGGIIVLPVIAVYTLGVYWVFRGKTQRGDSKYG